MTEDHNILEFRLPAIDWLAAYCARVDLPEWRLGKLAVKNDKFMRQLRDPDFGVRYTTVERAVRWCRANPDGPVDREAA